jgi:RNA-binding protein YhbY
MSDKDDLDIDDLLEEISVLKAALRKIDNIEDSHIMDALVEELKAKGVDIYA